MYLKYRNAFRPQDFTDEQLQAEVDLIEKKQSKLSAKERNKTVGYYYFKLEKQKRQ